MHVHLKNYVKHPIQNKGLYKFSNEYHQHNTRQRDLICLPLAKPAKYQSSFRYNDAKTWNSLPSTIPNLPRNLTFKWEVKTYLINELEIMICLQYRSWTQLCSVVPTLFGNDVSINFDRLFLPIVFQSGMKLAPPLTPERHFNPEWNFIPVWREISDVRKNWFFLLCACIRNAPAPFAKNSSKKFISVTAHIYFICFVTEPMADVITTICQLVLARWDHWSLYNWIAHSLCTAVEILKPQPPSYYSLSSTLCGFGSSRKTIKKM